MGDVIAGQLIRRGVATGTLHGCTEIDMGMTLVPKRPLAQPKRLSAPLCAMLRTPKATASIRSGLACSQKVASSGRRAKQTVTVRSESRRRMPVGCAAAAGRIPTWLGACTKGRKVPYVVLYRIGGRDIASSHICYPWVGKTAREGDPGMVLMGHGRAARHGVA